MFPDPPPSGVQSDCPVSVHSDSSSMDGWVDGRMEGFHSYSVIASLLVIDRR
jgi:hypothetical protein